MPERSRQQRAYYVERTMRALEALAVEPLSAPQIAERLQIPYPRTARAMLDSLVADGWLTRSEGRPARTYAPAPRLVALARQITERWG
jgi:DNA-binding IclR family transcriptional regulator